MALQWIPLDTLVPHPENSNRMSPRLLEKLKGHIQRTGLYEPLVVRPLPAVEGKGERPASGAANCDSNFPVPSPESPVPPLPSVFTPRSELRAPSSQFQILNGHHRARALGELGHTHARCDVWEVDDREARLLLATLNRLEGRDDPSARAALVARLAEGRSPEDLARLLPEPADAVERLLRLAAPPPEPADPKDLAPMMRPMTFFLTEEQHALVSEALQQCGVRSAECGVNNKQGQRDEGTEGRRNGNGTPPFPVPSPEPACRRQVPVPPLLLPSTPHSELRTPHCLSRAERLERLALWYLEAKNLR